MVESLQFFIFVISVFENTLKFFNTLLYARINVFHFACLKRIFLVHFNKKKRKPTRSSHAPAALLALWLTFKKGLKP
ncbi:hypothetical protein EC532_03440 [Helicobacter pylori]|nr:hypothetical protein EC532_03440 [Helicobacter pylori]